ncbi:Protein of unknown function [Pyronema omphalodes CBS 100304]|uniref:Uncharacterized protein n=1 Tax=Pyronema omphalodes (strain CBS 100304) TaxID=1076935 RepID=U4LE93_PYROM|nr:Protein of unknown function [Pyronema omphalodes CBS 100304]
MSRRPRHLWQVLGVAQPISDPTVRYNTFTLTVRSPSSSLGGNSYLFLEAGMKAKSYHKAVISGDTVKALNAVRSVDNRWLYQMRYIME